jgi:hypothetical protein
MAESPALNSMHESARCCARSMRSAPCIPALGSSAGQLGHIPFPFLFYNFNQGYQQPQPYYGGQRVYYGQGYYFD